MTNSVVPIVIVASLLCGGIQPSDSSNDSIRKSATHTLSKHDPEVDLASATNTANATCPPWFIPDSNSTTGCKCGSTYRNIVKCDHVSQRSYLLKCYAMTYDQDSQTDAVVAHSIFGCLFQTKSNSFYVSLPPTVSDLNQMMCGHANREGQLCGRCKDGFAVPIYSYDMACVRCSEHTTNWVKYIAAAFLPLTAFLVIVVVFRISACSAHLNGFVLVSQIIAAPPLMRRFATHANRLNVYRRIVDALASFYGIWNLDFFRSLYSPFCLYPGMTTLEALAFDYIIAVYPLALIVIMYLLIKLHDHNFRPVVCLWKPFHFCTARFRSQLDIRRSLVDAYATFFLLSYVKILSISYDILLPATLIDIQGHTLDRYYLYHDGTVEFFGETHRPYAILAIAVLVVFIFSPLLLLIVYQCRCFHRCTQHCGFTCNILHAFMDAFQGCYKDGTNGNRDYQYFPVVYFILRILMVVAYVITRSEMFYQVGGVLWIITAFLVSMIRPYKVDVYTTLDVFLLTCSAVGYMSTLLAQTGSTDEPILMTTSAIAVSVLTMTPLLYIMARVICWFLGRTGITTFFHKFQAKYLKETSLEDSLPHRMTHVDEYTPLVLERAAKNDQDESRQWTENTAYGV